MVNVPGEPPPRVQAVQGLSALEHGLRRAAERVAEDAPDGSVDRADMPRREGGAGDRLLEARDGDLVGILAFGPLEDPLEDGGPRDGVPLELALPL